MFTVKVEAEKLFTFLGGVVEKFRTAAMEESEASLTDIQTQMRVAGKPISYPVHWDSPKQQRYVMWKLSKEGNLPYQRTNSYINNWTLAKFADGIGLVNKHPAGAIGGTLSGAASGESFGTASWQSKIHEGRWPRIAPLVFKALSNLAERILKRMGI